MTSEGDTEATESQELAQPRDTEPVLIGYTSGELLGRGGMGEVVLAHDQRVGRHVAVKRMRGKSPSDESVMRFLREARIQARLEHPAIVPVYELGEASDGTPFFTMKRLTGVTLAELLAGRGTPLGLKGTLRALVDVALAVEFAHSRGVVHRDLKPSNIMLGDFGEVYVLDWGVARVLDAEAVSVAASDIESLDGQTQVGALLGTPGYMAPEQIAGPAVGPRADLYSLGAILFEVLAGEPLHPRGTDALVTTLTSPIIAPSERRPDRTIAPELDAACMAALAMDPRDRPTARAFADHIQRYLDGDRDTERRRVLAIEGVERARAALESGDSSRRGEAMSAAGRALALDPESTEAARVVGMLMLEPPEELPRELVERLREADLDLDVRAAHSATYAMLAFLLFAPLLWWMGVKSWPLIGVLIGFVVILALSSAWMVRTRKSRLMLFMLGFSAMMALLSQLFSPFVLIPGMLGVSSAALIAQPDFTHRPWLPIAVALAAWGAAFGFEELGVFASTWSMAGDALTIRSGLVHLDGSVVTALLILGNVSLIVVNGFYAHALASTRRAASRQLEIQAWHLGKLLPEARLLVAPR
jgi:eukaryotic-like serine/threonine-protein kinase